MRNMKEINIENRTYYLFDDMINIRDFDSNLPKIEVIQTHTNQEVIQTH